MNTWNGYMQIWDAFENNIINFLLTQTSLVQNTLRENEAKREEGDKKMLNNAIKELKNACWVCSMYVYACECICELRIQT